MLRYKRLLEAALDPDVKHPITQRDLARKIGLPTATMGTYIVDNVHPGVDNARKIAAYFGEDLSSMFSDDDDLTARLVAAIRRLPDQRKRELLESLR